MRFSAADGGGYGTLAVCVAPLFPHHEDSGGVIVERVGGEPATAELQCRLDALRGDAADQREKGDKFEVLVADIIRKSPMYRSDFSGVWLCSDWPGKPASGRDLDIDMVAVDAESGQLVAVQCKFRSESYRLQKSDIDSFLAESGKDEFVRRVTATMANDLAANLFDTIQHQQIPVTVWDTSTIASYGIDWSTYRPDSGEVPHFDADIGSVGRPVRIPPAHAATSILFDRPVSHKHCANAGTPSWSCTETDRFNSRNVERRSRHSHSNPV